MATSIPTNHFKLSVAGVLGKKQSEADKRCREKRASLKSGDVRVNAPVNLPAKPEVSQLVDKTIKDATIEELWAELQSRGVVVDGGHLVLIQRRVIA